MALTPSIRNNQRLAANQTVAASVALVDVGLTTNAFTYPIAAGQRVHFRIKMGFTLGATGGFRFRLDGPAAPTSYLNCQEVNDGVTASPGAQIESVITVMADFANALAVAGNHALEMEGDFVASVAGNLKLQFACNTAANAITLLQGGWMEVDVK